MRGKASLQGSFHDKRGITPAYAGKSFCVSGVEGRNRDHPRPCGEKKKGRCFIMRVKGSPPPMRGKVRLEGEEVVKYGITPAYAGKRRILV